MTASAANLFNAIVLIAAGIIGYFMVPAAHGPQSPTALIPAIFGILFLVLHKGVASGNKIVSHIVVTLTIVLLVMCIMRFVKVNEWDAKKYIFLACILSNAIATIAFIGSFITARRNRKLNG